MKVTSQPGLASNHNAISNLSTAADTCLCGNNCAVSYFYIMCYLYKVVQFSTAFDQCGANSSPVDSSI